MDANVVFFFYVSRFVGKTFTGTRIVGKSVVRTISRCSKLFYTFSRRYFHIESMSSGASVSFVLSHIARYAPSPEENSCIPTTHFQCKNNFEHLLMKSGTPLSEVVLEEMKLQIQSSSEKFRRLLHLHKNGAAPMINQGCALQWWNKMVTLSFVG